MIHPKSRVYVEGKKIEVVRPNFEKQDARLNYNSVDELDKAKVMNGTWGFNGSNGPSLIVQMKKARNIRLKAETFHPKVGVYSNYEFNIIVDGRVLYPRISNWSSIDVYGKQVIVSLASWPTSSSGLYITGTYQIF